MDVASMTQFQQWLRKFSLIGINPLLSAGEGSTGGNCCSED
jgi:hypothetical protein